MKTAIMKQPAGIGDILFCQKIATMLQQKYDVVWPIIPQYLGIKPYLPHINFVDINSSFAHRDFYFSCPKGQIIENDNCVIIGTDGTLIEDSGVMVSKYKLVGLDHTDWVDYIKLNRNTVKEDELFYTVLQLKDGEEYIVINDTTGSLGHESETKWVIPHPADKKVIKLQLFGGFEIFDWCKVFERCSEFHIIDTSISYIIEKINTTEKVYKMYHRSNSDDKDFKDFTKLHKKPQSHGGRETLQPPIA
jgi:hypothetical protein